MERAQRTFLLSGIDRGILFGLIVRKPASGLTATYDGGIVRVGSTNLPVPVVEKAVSGSTIAITASKDAYLYVDSSGVLQKVEVANGAAKPLVATIGVNSEFVAKVVTNGTDITSVQDLRRDSPHGRIWTFDGTGSFETGEQASNSILVPISGRLLAVQAIVTKALAITDVGTVTPAIGENDVYTNVTMDVAISFPLSSALEVRRLSLATALNAIRGGNYLKLTTAKTTAGGKLAMQAFVEEAR